ncbi:putative beta-lysine N-acetyltransferase [Alkalibacter saccharofermentans]|uniref:Beta-lysine acetyltransferase n=1 Tax=Alkalibacter saccharofermentans DSM 14828 TaxID=1120975 RepID=A0A1M4WIV8_9FIRM|nr:putative beta-lysine N-acetyltransferase [Alkalibacter saccharofermentans]SHE81135.1 beta-lysine acetyltransferase [Alkalibacter saccharofermentans DSM 14828]
MGDKVEFLGHSLIQHGKDNDRIYLMKYDYRDETKIIDSLKDLADKYSYSKIFAKVPLNKESIFLTAGYTREAKIPNYKSGEEDYVFLGKYMDHARGLINDSALLDDVLATARSKAKVDPPPLEDGHVIKKLTKEDAPEMAGLYKRVFKTYPFPIHDADYLIKTMEENIHYYGIFQGKKLVALSSSETDPEYKNCEMTDFATLPNYRGKKFALVLLFEMEKSMKALGFKTLYTIARAKSHGMNATFAKAGYAFGGMLINNTNISGDIESMNVWYKII